MEIFNPLGSTMSIANLRENYDKDVLLESNINPNPFKQFQLWFDQARAEGGLEPNAMTVSTVSADGKPSSRICLLKDFDENGFVFFTNYTSVKGQDLATNPHASLLFFWMIQQRQVHINGRVEKISTEESTDYFKSRPIGSQIGAWASLQSQEISREVLEKRYADYEAQFGQEVPKPEHWGGYRVIPESIEFWQGRPSRLHDRLKFTRDAVGQWQFTRLSP